jgi:iron complex transport system ATP-binding protein
MLVCKSLTLEVPGRVLCKDLEVRFERGEVWAVLGRNGSGKSTLIHALGGLAQPTRGEVEVDGKSLVALSARQRARNVGVLPQIEEGTYWGSVTDYVLLGRFPHARPWSGFSEDDALEARRALEAVGMSGFATQRYATLSGGERQRVRIAQILAQQPRIFLLDEPLQHLDLAHQAHVIALMGSRARARQETVVMVLHEPLWIGSACTHALIFNGDGTAIAGPVEALLTRETLERAYGCKLREVQDAEGRCFIPDV